jgi:hypothetical protein
MTVAGCVDGEVASSSEMVIDVCTRGWDAVPYPAKVQPIDW